MATDADIRPAPTPAAGAAFLREQLFFAVVALVAWCWVAWRDGAAAFHGPRQHAAVAAALMLLARLGASAVEAGAYVLFWRVRGERLPYARFLMGLVALSLADYLALCLTGLARHDAALAPWLAPLAGVSLVRERWPGIEPGLWSGFGSLGLLTLGRVAMTGWLQAHVLGRRLRGPLLVTFVAWLASRVVVWWTVDLARGLSPVR